jgi:hypothetical protein
MLSIHTSTGGKGCYTSGDQLPPGFRLPSKVSCFFCQQILFLLLVLQTVKGTPDTHRICYIFCSSFLHITSRHTILTQWNTLLLKKVTLRSARHEITRLLWNWKSHVAFITAHKRSPLQIRWSQPTASQPISVMILFSNILSSTHSFSEWSVLLRRWALVKSTFGLHNVKAIYW